MSSEHFHHSKEGDDWSDTSSRSEKQVSYEVERIIAETEGPEGQPVYLVKWKGYKDYRSTWEPASSFETPEILREWQQQLANGDFLDEVTLESLLDRMQAYKERGRGKSNIFWRNRRDLLENDGTRESTEENINAPLNTHNFIGAASSHSNSTTTHRQNGLAPKLSSFRGISSKPRHLMPTSMSIPRNEARTGQRFRNLSEQNRFSKSIRQDTVPDASRLKLQTPSQWFANAGDDTALNLPSGEVASAQLRLHVVPPQIAAHDEALAFSDANEENQMSDDQPEASSASLVEERHIRDGAPVKDCPPGKDQLIAALGFERFDIGKICLRGVTQNVKEQLSTRLNENQEVILHFRQSDVVNLSEYSHRCIGLSNEVRSVISIHGYEASNKELNGLGQYLEDNGAAVLWADSQVDFSLILYSTTSPWTFLERGVDLPVASRLRLAVRDPILVGVHSDSHPAFDMKRKGKENHLSSSFRFQTESGLRLRELLDMDIEKIWHEISHGDRAIKETEGAQAGEVACFLNFPDSAGDISGPLRQALVSRIPEKLVFNDWKPFAKVVASSEKALGLALIDESRRPAFCVPGLAKILYRNNVRFFRVIGQLTQCGNFGLKFDRMYPRGMVLMVSSGSMSLETDATIACLEWFIDTARNKPSRWRLMIPPDCLEALETQALSRVDGDVESLLKLLTIIRNLVKEITEDVVSLEDAALRQKNTYRDKYDGLLLSEPSLAAYQGPVGKGQISAMLAQAKDRWMLNFFGGWAMKNMFKYRRFVALTATVPKHVDLLHHIEIATPQAFYRRLAMTESSRRS